MDLFSNKCLIFTSVLFEEGNLYLRETCFAHFYLHVFTLGLY